MAEQIVNENTLQKGTEESGKKIKKSSQKRKKRNRETLILPEVDSVKEKIILAISDVAKRKEYFTNEDIFSDLITKMQIDLSNIKRIKSLYSYISKVTIELEDKGYLKGHSVPGTRKIYWKLMRPLVS